MITNAPKADEAGLRVSRDRLSRARRGDVYECPPYRPAPVASSITRLEEVERQLAALRSRPAGRELEGRA